MKIQGWCGYLKPGLMIEVKERGKLERQGEIEQKLYF